jgi:anti-anti-sigma regulatory factor
MIEPLIAATGRRDVPRSESVLTVVKGDEVVVWLIGDLDLSVAAELDEVAEHAPRVARWLTIDASRVTYCDSVLLRFIAKVSETMYVSVRRPSAIFADILALSGLAGRMLVEGAPHSADDSQSAFGGPGH